MGKRVVCIIASFCIVFSLLSFGHAEDEIKVTFNGSQLSFDVPPTLIEGRTMLPLRAIFEAFGATVDWNDSEKKVKGVKGSSIVELQIDNKTAKVNGKDIVLDVPGTLVNGRTMVPARFIAESFGADVGWIPETRTVTITYVRKGDVENIDYSNPDKYLVQGKQTDITEAAFKEIDKQLNIKTKELSDIKKVLDWKNSNYKSVSGGGKTVGKSTINDILQSKELAGCHDHAILAASILRKYGFPVVMVDATGIQFSMDYPDKTKMFSGHVFVEIYLQNRWILVDSTSGDYILDYDVKNPVIPVTKSVESKGYYVMLKGPDPDGYGINDIKQLNDIMIEYSKKLKEDPSLIKIPAYTVKKF